jgi:SAM-dependent methyltransferase
MAGVSPRWEDARTVAGFSSGAPNAVLVAFASRFLDPTRQPLCLDIGCGAARNAVALAELGYRVVGTDLSSPMLEAARRRVRATPVPLAVDLTLTPMAPLPFGDAVFDVVVAHGIWNLAHSGTEFRAAIAEAARVARAGAGLFLFTFSRHTLPGDTRPDSGESFVFSSWNGEPQCFLTEEEVVYELARAGFVRDAPGPLTEYNAPRPGEIRAGGPPVIYEGTFIRRTRTGTSTSRRLR